MMLGNILCCCTPSYLLVASVHSSSSASNCGKLWSQILSTSEGNSSRLSTAGNWFGPSSKKGEHISPRGCHGRTTSLASIHTTFATPMALSAIYVEWCTTKHQSSITSSFPAEWNSMAIRSRSTATVITGNQASSVISGLSNGTGTQTNNTQYSGDAHMTGSHQSIKYPPNHQDLNGTPHCKVERGIAWGNV
jgi:hypothetical protein